MLTPDQRKYHYTLEAERTGIHQPILAALYEVQQQPKLEDGLTGLGISPANRVSLDQLNTFAEQVQFAANTVRSLIADLGRQGWSNSDLWNSQLGRYPDKFIQRLANGYAPPASEPSAARIEASNADALLKAYNRAIADNAPLQGMATTNLTYLDPALLTFTERVPNFYQGLVHQKTAVLEAVRIWRRLDTQQQAIASLLPNSRPDQPIDDAQLWAQIRQFLQRVVTNYGGFPQEREALLRMAQLWRQLPSREAAIASLQANTSAEPNLNTIDPALVAFVNRIPSHFRSQAAQRSALLETVRLWRQLENRNSAISSLGIDPNQLNTTNANALATVVAQLDRELVAFMTRIPKAYKEQTHQRESLIRLVQLWRSLPGRPQTIQSLYDDLKAMQNQKPEQPPPPKPRPRPDRWTLNNIQLEASIVLNGSFTWAEATRGGTRMPPDQATVDAIIRIARLAQRARDQLGRPMIVTSWYRDPKTNAAVGGVFNSRHIVGDAIDFYCDGLTGDEIYWLLEPWWPGGLGRYLKFPYLSHIDAREYRARWQN